MVLFAALEEEVAQQEGVVARSRATHEEVAKALQARRAALTRCDEAMAAATAERQARSAARLLGCSCGQHLDLLISLGQRQSGKLRKGANDMHTAALLLCAC